MPCVKSRSIACLLESWCPPGLEQLPEEERAVNPQILSHVDDNSWDEATLLFRRSGVASSYQRVRRPCCIRTEGETDVGGDGIVKP